jgi:hypothetical protein
MENKTTKTKIDKTIVEEINIENTLENVVVESTPEVKSNDISSLEASIIARSEKLNIPALCAFFGITESEVRKALAKK